MQIHQNSANSAKVMNLHKTLGVGEKRLRLCAELLQFDCRKATPVSLEALNVDKAHIYTASMVAYISRIVAFRPHLSF